MSFTLRARWVLPVDRPPIAGGCVTIDGECIREVGPQPPAGASVAHLGDVLLLPGLVNAHTHLEFSDLRRPLGRPAMTLPAWIRLVIGMRKRSDRNAAAAITAGLHESLRSGVTTLGEIATSQASSYADEAQHARTVRFQEAIGFSAARIHSVFADVQRLAASPPDGLSPHAPYTVHPQLLKRIVDLSTARDVPIAMHVAESPEELQLLATGKGAFRDLLEERSMWDENAILHGSRPLDYLRVLAEAPRAIVIHGNYLDQTEIAFLGQHRERMSVVYCPRTHEYFRHAAYPLEAMLAAGVRVALGTDSRASNPDLNLLSELRCVRRKSPATRPDELLRMATLSGAEALGLAAEVGSLTPGKRADMIAISCGAKPNDPYAPILEGASEPDRVWLAGRDVTKGQLA